MTIRMLYLVVAIFEGANGVALMIYPPLVTRLLLGDGVSGTAMGLGRVAGFALLSLALACWPGRSEVRGKTPVLRAILSYNLLVTLYLLVLGIGGESVGTLLWPAFAVHALLTFLLARAWFDKSWPRGTTESAT